MKKVLVLLLAINLLWSCNSKKAPENKDAANPTDTTQHHQAEGVERLTLNNNAKWKADAATTSNVDNLKTIIADFNIANNRTLAGYQTAGSDLQKGLDKMVSECGMKGAGHDALHNWLLPLLTQVKEYQHSSTTAVAAEKLNGISTRVNNYYQYFE